MHHSTFDIQDNPTTGKVDVIRIDGDTVTVLAECDSLDEACDEREAFEEGYHDGLDSMRAGDDPRYEAPDDPYAEQHELAALQRSQY